MDEPPILADALAHARRLIALRLRPLIYGAKINGAWRYYATADGHMKANIRRTQQQEIARAQRP